MASFPYESSSSSSSSSDDESHVPDLSSLGFSPETLAALQWHFAQGSPPLDSSSCVENNKDNDTDALKASAEPQLNPVHETIRRLKAADAIAQAHHQGEVYTHFIDTSLKTDLVARPSTNEAPIGSKIAIQQAHNDLLNEGVVRLNNCVPRHLCIAALAEVNQQMRSLEPNKKCGERTREEGFGGVLARKCRYDAYQHPIGAFQNMVSCLYFLLLLL
jgi:hypothetical protein